jgi:RNA-splicing ligase RtcB
MPLTLFYDEDGYVCVYQPNLEETQRFNRSIAKYVLMQDIDGMHVHHKDDEKLNNFPNNLDVLTSSEHMRLHALENQIFNRQDFRDKKAKTISERGYFFDPKYAEKKAAVASDNIQRYMRDNSEDFARVVKENAIRGGKFFSSENSNENMIVRQKLGRIRYVLLDVIESGEQLSLESYSRHRSSEYNALTTNYVEEILRRYSMSLEDVVNKDCWDSKLMNNHKVSRVEFLDYCEDVYCLNVDKYHNFALSSGVFVHNCGMEITGIHEKSIDYDKLDQVIRQYVPSGFSKRQKEHSLTKKLHLNDLHCLNHINVSNALVSLGTLGGGNHFIEVDISSDNQLYLVVHSGSRHLGLEVAKYYQKLAIEQCHDYDPDEIKHIIEKLKSEGRQREIQDTIKNINAEHKNVSNDLAFLSGTLFDEYIHDMKIVQEFAMLNRQAMTDEILSRMNLHATESFTTIHNYIDTEHMILRKGAVSAMSGEKLIIPINMRDGSLICSGKGNPDWNCSAPHGAGRLMSRSAAKETFSVQEFQSSMDGIYTTSVGRSTLDECPMAYKPIESIIDNISDTVEILDIIKPAYNFKAGDE